MTYLFFTEQYIVQVTDLYIVQNKIQGMHIMQTEKNIMRESHMTGWDLRILYLSHSHVNQMLLPPHPTLIRYPSHLYQIFLPPHPTLIRYPSNLNQMLLPFHHMTLPPQSYAPPINHPHKRNFYSIKLPYRHFQYINYLQTDLYILNFCKKGNIFIDTGKLHFKKFQYMKYQPVTQHYSFQIFWSKKAGKKN